MGRATNRRIEKICMGEWRASGLARGKKEMPERQRIPLLMIIDPMENFFVSKIKETNEQRIQLTI